MAVGDGRKAGVPFAQRPWPAGSGRGSGSPTGGSRASGTLPLIGSGARDWSASGTGTAATSARV